MNVMRADRAIFKVLGIIKMDGQNQLPATINKFLVSTSAVVFMISMICYFVKNFYNVVEATSAFYLICITGMSLTIYLQYWTKRSTIQSIIRRIEKKIENSPIEFRPFYEDVDLLAFRIARSIHIFSLTSVFIVCALPAFLMLLMLVTGNDPKDIRFVPAALELPVDTETWFGFFIAYAVVCFGGYGIAIPACLFINSVSISVYVEATFDEIRFRLTTIKQNLKEPWIESGAKLHGREILNQLVVVFKNHLEVLDLLKEVESIFVRLKYNIFSFGGLALCTALFQVQQSALNGSHMILQMLVVCSCVIMVLFNFCYSGEKIIHAHDISGDVYNLCWYRFDTNCKYMVWFMIARSQKTFWFSSYKAGNCSLEVFVNIMRTATGVLTMLKSI